MKTYTFHVSLPGFGRVWRKLELPGEATLADLHIAIQDAYDFDRDHLYSFFMSGKAWDSATEYSLPEGPVPGAAPGPAKTSRKKRAAKAKRTSRISRSRRSTICARCLRR